MKGTRPAAILSGYARGLGRWSAGVLLPAALLWSCGESGVAESAVSRQSAVPDCYAFLSGGGPRNAAEREKTWSDLPYSRIELLRYSVFDSFGGDSTRDYMIVMERGGAARAGGHLPNGSVGNFSGEVNLWDYARLCQVLDGARLEPAKYTRGPSHADWAILGVFRGDERSPLQIEEYACSGPAELWTVLSCIDAVATRVEWKPEAEAPRLTIRPTSNDRESFSPFRTR
jgi:hypothetical protein